MKKSGVLALCAVAVVLACVSDPVKKGKPGTIDVMTGTAGAPVNPTGAAGESTGAGEAGSPAMSGAAGAEVDPKGVAGASDGNGNGTTSGTAGAPDASGAAGGNGAGGTTGAADGGTTSGAAGMSPTAGASGHAGGGGAADAGAAGRSDAGVPASKEVATPVMPSACDHASWTFTANTICTTACATAADSSKLPANAIDGDPTTRYTTGAGQKGGELVILTFPKLVTLSGINLLSMNGDGPMAYLVEYSLDGANFSSFNPPRLGAGSDNLTVTFPSPTKLLALRITQTGVKPSNWWSIHELTAIGCVASP